VFVEGFACFICMDLLQMANTCGLHDGKSFNFNGNFKGKRHGVLELNKKATVRQKPSSPHDSVWSHASVALVRIDLRPETSEK